MTGPLRKLVQVIVRDGLLRTLERGWAALFCGIGSWRISHLLGGIRNLWRLPRVIVRHHGGKLSLGCGPDHREGWLDADLGLAGEIHLDAGRRFPFADGFFSLILSEHMLEHLTEAQAAACLRECHRVLQPGGILRLSTPDLAHCVRGYLQPEEETVAARQQAAQASAWKYPNRPPSPGEALNDGFYLWEHRRLYDERDLTAALQAAGFTDVRRYSPGVGSSELTTGLESRIDDSLVVEARRT